MSNFVSVQCPCGESFDREIKRGRPAIWCVECRKFPVAQRIQRPVGEDGVTAENKVSRFGSNDVLTYDQREAVEAGVGNANASFESVDFAALFAGEDERDVPFLIADWKRRRYEEVYASVR